MSRVEISARRATFETIDGHRFVSVAYERAGPLFVDVFDARTVDEIAARVATAREALKARGVNFHLSARCLDRKPRGFDAAERERRFRFDYDASAAGAAR